jgi:short-subunit dehydrogenase
MSGRAIAGSRVLVTGASSGIGRELARQLAAQGARVVMAGRRAERLEQLAGQIAAAGGLAHAVAGDLTEPDVRQRAVQAAVDRFGGLDALVNNAGLGAQGAFVTADAARLRAVMEVNFFVPAELIRAALPLLARGTRPIVVNIGSVLGHRAVPRKSEYCASKFALHGLSDALRAELAPLGIHVLLVSPSTTESEFFDHSWKSPDAAASQPAVRARAMPAGWVAQRTIRAMRTDKHEILLPTSGKLLVWLDRLWPALADRLVARFA